MRDMPIARNTPHTIIALLFLSLCSLFSPKAHSASLITEIGGGVLGLEVNASLQWNRYIGLRGGINRLAPQFIVNSLVNNPVNKTLFSTLCSGSSCQNSLFSDPNVNIDIETYNGYLDIYPFGIGFRLTGGLLYGKLDAGTTFIVPSSETGTQISFGNNSISSDYVNSIETKVSLGEYSPYVGIGWSSSLGRNSRFGTFINIGAVIILNPRVQVTATLTSDGQDLVPFDLEEASQEEARRVEQDMRTFPFIPHISIGITYRLF